MKYFNDYLQMPYYSNIPVHFLQNHLNKVFNDSIYNNILKEASVHKLTLKEITINNSFANYIIIHFDEKKITRI